MKHKLIKRCRLGENPEGVKLQLDLGAAVDKELVTTPRVMMKLVKLGIGNVYYWGYDMEASNEPRWNHLLGSNV